MVTRAKRPKGFLANRCHPANQRSVLRHTSSLNSSHRRRWGAAAARAEPGHPPACRPASEADQKQNPCLLYITLHFPLSPQTREARDGKHPGRPRASAHEPDPRVLQAVPRVNRCPLSPSARASEPAADLDPRLCGSANNPLTLRTSFWVGPLGMPTIYTSRTWPSSRLQTIAGQRRR
jgi:hypothetical protein